MGRPSAVDEKDVARAAVRLIGQGAKPTVDAVREAVGGRGSRTTIHKHLKAFLDDFSRRGLTVLPSSIPEPLLPIIEDFWSQALAKAGERYDEDRGGWESQIGELNAVIDSRNSVIVERDALLTDRERFIGQQQRAIEGLETEVEQLSGVVADQGEVVADLKRDKGRLSDQVKSEREQAQLRMDQALEDWARERAQLERAVEDSRKQFADSEQKMNTLTDYWIMQVEDARQRVSEQKERHAQDRNLWDANAKLERARADRLAQTVSEYERRVDVAETELVEAEGRVSELREDLAAALETVALKDDELSRLQSGLVTSQADLKIANKEIERLMVKLNPTN